MRRGRQGPRVSYGPGVPDPIFRFVCVPAALDGAPDGWAVEMLKDGEIGLLVDAGGLEAVNAVARALDLVTISVLRTEQTPTAQEQTVQAHAAALPLVWVAGSFGDAARAWAHKRGPMTLLVETDGPLAAEERRRIERFVAILGRQSE